MFAILKGTPQLHLAQAWIPSNQCAEINYTPNFETITMERAKYKVFVDYEDEYNSVTTHFLKASKLHGLILGKGIAGRLLATYKSFFCLSICNFSITEYPLVHYAQLARLTVSFAVCLQSIQTGDNIYVLEFFLLPGSIDRGYSWSFLPFLLTVMQKQLKSFKFATGQLLGDGLSVKAIEFCKDTRFDFLKVGHQITYPLKFETLYYDDEMKKLNSSFHQLNFGRELMDVEQGSTAVEKSKRGTTTSPSKREREKTNFNICFEDLKPYFGKTLEDAQKGLGGKK